MKRGELLFLILLAVVGSIDFSKADSKSVTITCKDTVECIKEVLKNEK